MKSYGKFNVVLFIDDGFDSLVSKHNTRQAAVKAAAIKRARYRRDVKEERATLGFALFSDKHSYRVVTAGTLKNAFGLEVR